MEVFLSTFPAVSDVELNLSLSHATTAQSTPPTNEIPHLPSEFCPLPPNW